MFLTGSQVYGQPKDNSDLDVVIVIRNDGDPLLKLVYKFADTEGDSATGERFKRGRSLRFGKLNLIILPSLDEAELWSKTTDYLIERAPVDKRMAISTFEEAYKNSGIKRRPNL